MTPEGVHATVVLDRAVTRFAFNNADVVREGDFELLTPGLTMTGDTVTSPTPFRRFALRIRPMKKERDAKYPAHFRVGQGGVLYAPALTGDSTAWRTRLTLKTTAGQVRSPEAGDISQGFVFIGPAALRVNHKGIVVVADPQTPAWLVERSRTALASAVTAFTDALDAPLPRKPLLIVKHEPGDRDFNVGDVTPGAVTALRFHGPRWQKPDLAAAKRIESFVLHEAFHFWNGGLAESAPENPSWLHEGAAEYASLLGGLNAGVLTVDEVRAELTQALGQCQTALQADGDKGMAEMRFLPSQVRYPCGTVLQWAADLRTRGASGNRRTIMDAWRDIIRGARGRTTRQYRLADFYAASGIAEGDAFAPVHLLVHRSGPRRWDELGTALNALGASVDQVATPAGRRGKLLFHLLDQNCRNLPAGTGRGFHFGDRRIKLDSPAGCGVLAGDPVIESVEGGDPYELTVDTYEAVGRRCAASQPVTIKTVDGRILNASCAEALPAAPRDYVVKRWLPAATASSM
jgi:hypothetical protein